MQQEKQYNSVYKGKNLDRLAFPLGGIGAGMICLEGTGAISHVSIRNRPEVYNEPYTYSAISIKSEDENIAKVLQGPLRMWKVFGMHGTGNGAWNNNFGLPRCDYAEFRTHFPFGMIKLEDKQLPIDVEVTGWSPFTPTEPDKSSYPFAAIEYSFKNTTDKKIEGVYSFHTLNFLKVNEDAKVESIDNGFILHQPKIGEDVSNQAWFCAMVDDENTKVNCSWFRGPWFDSRTVAWDDVEKAKCYQQGPPKEGSNSPGASIFVPLDIEPGGEQTVRLLISWYAPESNLRFGDFDKEKCCPDKTHKPWYSGQFGSMEETADHWKENVEQLRKTSKTFADSFYDTTLPDEVIEAVAANLTILKSPTVLRQTDGKLWAWEGCCDGSGCCHGSCTHVWNYAQALCHIFPSLERSFRETEYFISQSESGHQTFRTNLPICEVGHTFHAASDGQLGGIMKAYREWRISGDTEWIKKLWPQMKLSLSYCINTWDPEHRGLLWEPHHNTYDIEFYGPDAMCTSFYLGALKAASMIARELGDDHSLYDELLEKGKKYLDDELFNGHYYHQKVIWDSLREKLDDPDYLRSLSYVEKESIEMLKEHGPKYQFGSGCISDGIVGQWLANMCGIGDFLDKDKIIKHLDSVHKYNLKKDLSNHVNTQRPGFAAGSDGGLLLCTWPMGNKPLIPFVYSDEVWTGIEYQVACHLIINGMVDKGLEIVRTCRDRYDGTIRNPFDEYECGHWYARAMSSYGLIQALTGIRYDAVDKKLYISPRIEGDFRSFLCTAGGYGNVGIKDGKPFIDVRFGNIDVQNIEYDEYKE